jgi:predicted transcriptional regulator of viral defense system
MAPSHGVFRKGQILAGQSKPASVERQLDRWIKSGCVIMLRRGVYALAEPYAKQEPHPFVVANQIKRASYVSLQSALSHYGMIPEYVPVTTSITTGRPETLNTPMGRYQYRHVARHLFCCLCSSNNPGNGS